MLFDCFACGVKQLGNYHYFISVEENLAYGKQTYQYSGKFKDGSSGKAVDGNSNTNFENGNPRGSCTMTNPKRDQPWWRVDLGQDELVAEVYVVNRLNSDCGCGNRLDNLEIRVGRLFWM